MLITFFSQKVISICVKLGSVSGRKLFAKEYFDVVKHENFRPKKTNMTRKSAICYFHKTVMLVKYESIYRLCRKEV